MSTGSEEPNIQKCPYCLAEIQVEAKKCRHCGEWVITDSSKSVPEILANAYSSYGITPPSTPSVPTATSPISPSVAKIVGVIYSEYVSDLCKYKINPTTHKCANCGKFHEWVPTSSTFARSAPASNLVRDTPAPKPTERDFLYWYSKIFAITNGLAAIGAIFWLLTSETSSTSKLIYIIGIIFSIIFMFSFWKYEQTKAQWSFIVTALGSSLIALGLVLLAASVSNGSTFMQEDGKSTLYCIAFGSVIGCIITIYAAIKANREGCW